MTITDLDRIDILGTSISGGPMLIIVDPGELEPVKRLRMYKAKLALYAQVLQSKEFRTENPRWETSQIQLMCSKEPTEPMRLIRTIEVSSSDGIAIVIPVAWEIIFGGLE